MFEIMFFVSNFQGEAVLEIPEKYIATIDDEFTSFHHVEEKDIIDDTGEIAGTITIAIQLSLNSKSACSL